MNAQTAALLVDLNRQFYQTFAGAFSSTRRRLQPGVRKVLETLIGDESILDLGCGNGELARALSRRGHRGAYTGLDFSLSLLEDAQAQPGDFPATFIASDLTSPEWDRALVGSLFTLVTAFAFLHHIPGMETRRRILLQVHALLLPGGRFIHSEWQFLNSDKLKDRIQPWGEVGLGPDDVDPGDALLDWRHGGRGLRYVHQFDQAELEALAAASGFKIQTTFLSDGENKRLGLYQLWSKE
ncbi:MAG: methyltransferase domain-containing protein [Chloroflexota bacterium]